MEEKCGPEIQKLPTWPGRQLPFMCAIQVAKPHQAVSNCTSVTFRLLSAQYPPERLRVALSSAMWGIVGRTSQPSGPVFPLGSTASKVGSLCPLRKSHPNPHYGTILHKGEPGANCGSE